MSVLELETRRLERREAAADARVVFDESALTDVSLPLLQDVPEVNAWATWGVAWRDVVLVDSRDVGQGGAPAAARQDPDRPGVKRGVTRPG